MTSRNHQIDNLLSLYPSPLKETLRCALTEILCYRKKPINALHLKDEDLTSLYALGYRRFEKSQYHDALKIFYTLYFLNLKEPKYPLAIGLTHLKLQQPAKAISPLLISWSLDFTIPTPAFHLIDIFLKLNFPPATSTIIDALEYTRSAADQLTYYKLLQTKLPPPIPFLDFFNSLTPEVKLHQQFLEVTYGH